VNPRLLHETGDWVAVSKPPGMLCHPTKPGGPPTLREWFHGHYPAALGACVNRLDRETSGIVVIARTSHGASVLGKQLMARTVEKTYLALVHGAAPAQHTIDAPLARLGDHGPSAIYLKQGVVEGGAAAVTSFRTLGTRTHAQAGTVSLVECAPRTGRLHQIRVHLAHLGHPVVGDKLYGPDSQAYLEFIRTGWTDSLASRLHFPRQALHASSLAFLWGEGPVRIDDPLLEDMRAFWDSAT
jgi:23S rRNA pseudouridine1911/1915/1917 synthase